jgi:hypothetical protein
MRLSEIPIRIFHALPSRARETLKSRLGVAGHSRSFVDAWRARRLGVTWKKPDALVSALQDILDRIGQRSLDGCVVMEYGTGYLLADPLVYSMLGARAVHAVDYQPLLQAGAFRSYAANGDWQRFAGAISERRGRAATDAWFERLAAALRDGAPDWYRALGIRYVAPFDILADPPPESGYDFIVSQSTLEHVPEHLAPLIVARLADLVKPGGATFHYIHLADHRDIACAPYAFLSADDEYTPDQHDLRGNRMRASDWRAVFASLDFRWSVVTTPDAAELFPKTVCREFEAYDRDDLMINHFVIYGRRDIRSGTGA